MKRFARIARIASASILMVAAARTAGAQGMCRTLDVPGATWVSPHGINNNGDVVGEYVDGNGQYGFVRFANGQIVTINSPLNTWAVATGINNAGDVVGAYGGVPECNCVADIEAHGFRIINGAMSSFDIGASQTIPRGINAFGTIVGYYHDRDGDIEDAPRGFLMTAGGGVNRIDAPGGGPLSRVSTYLTGINLTGTVVGHAFTDGGTTYPFTWKAGDFKRQPRPPGASWWVATGGINKSGNFVGYYVTTTNYVGFIRSPRRYNDFTCPNASDTMVEGINDRGAMTGRYNAGETSIAFYTLPIAFIDPVPDLVNGTTVTTNNEDLATKGRPVQGAAADGSTIVVLRVPTANAGDQVTLSLLKADDDNQPATSIVEYGGLGTPTAGCCEFSVTVTSVTTGNGPTALAIYRVPADFPRADGSDADTGFRNVYVRVQAAGGTDLRFPLRLIRPPVAAVHGIWGGANTWNGFTPLISGAGNRFQFKRINYDDDLAGFILSSDPSAPWIGRAKGNSLGYKYNAGIVFGRVRAMLETFKTGENPEHIAVAATKVDIVAHSMGGTISRYMALLPGYTRSGFGEGLIHKLITVDTPHLGSPIADHMLRTDSSENNSSLRDAMALAKNFIFNRVTLSTAGTVPGAVGDLRTVGSDGLREINGSNEHPIPAAMVVGEYTNWGSLGPLTARGFALRELVGDSTLVWSLTSSRWPALFTDDPHRNDGIVSVKSQSNNAPTVVFASGSVVHSDSLFWFGFDSVSALAAASAVPSRVIDLLNQPVTNSSVWVSVTP